MLSNVHLVAVVDRATQEVRERRMRGHFVSDFRKAHEEDCVEKRTLISDR